MSRSPFAEYLDTNYAATSKDLPAIRTVIADTQKTVAVLDEQLKAYHSLIEQRKSCIASIDRHTALLAPMRRMPHDILMVIFHEFLALPVYRQAAMSCKHPSVVLSHVCTKWRSLALQDPRMWSSFVISLPIFPPMDSEDSVLYETLRRWTQKVDHILDLTRIWLARSGNYPLAFWLQVSAPYQNDNFDATEVHLSRLVQLLSIASRRWRDVDITLYIGAQGARTALLHKIINIHPKEFPLLRSLHLDISLNDLETDEDWSLETSAEAFPTTAGLLGGTQLRSMTIYLHGPSWIPGHAPPSWATLTTLAFRSSSIATSLGHMFVIELLSQCPRLVALEVGYLASNDDRDNNHEGLSRQHSPLQHSCLQRFHWIDGCMPLKALAHALELPALTSLQLPLRLDLRRSSEELLHWLKQYGPQLQRVSFNEFVLDDEPFAEVMECLQNVSVLKLESGVDLEPSEIETMAPRSAVRFFDTCWLPNLERLEASITDDGALFTEESLLAFIEARHQRRPGLQNVTVSFPQCRTMDLWSEIERRGVDTDRFKLLVKYPEPKVFEGPFLGENDADVSEWSVWG